MAKLVPYQFPVTHHPDTLEQIEYMTQDITCKWGQLIDTRPFQSLFQGAIIVKKYMLIHGNYDSWTTNYSSFTQA